MAIELRNTILNLYNSGISPDIISLELDLNLKDVMQIINDEVTDDKRRKIAAKKSMDTPLLNRAYLDTAVNIDSAIKNAQIRMWKALKGKPEFNISLEQTQNILERYAESKINLVILYVDLVGSTRLSMMLPIDRLTGIIRAFTQEMFLMVSAYGGYVLKYIGDAVLSFFLVQDLENDTDYDDGPGIGRDDNNASYLQCNNAITCAGSMIKVIREGINPILDQYGYPELGIRIGLDFGQDAVVQYGWDIQSIDYDDGGKKRILKKPHLDILGHTISIATKMTAIAKQNQIVIGQSLYDILDDRQRNTFRPLKANQTIWNYVDDVKGDIYKIYGSITESKILY